MTIANLRPENIIPYITTKYNYILEPNTQKTFILNGINFQPNTILTIPSFDGSIDNISILTPTELEFTITAGPTIAVYDIVLTNIVNNLEWAGNGQAMIDVKISNWIDLRTGGDIFTDGNGAGNDIRYVSGMAMSRDADGMWFTGLNPFSSWVKFESLGWARGQEKTIEWVFSTPNSTMMIGIGSDETNEASTAQYKQMENQAYMSSYSLISLYGNNGTPGSTGYHSGLNTAYGTYTAFKIKFTLDGRSAVPTSPAGVFTLYGIPSIAQSHWDDISNELISVTIGGTLAPDATNIMPSIIPRDGGTQRFAALRVI
jgi:hypothetical protein